MQKTLGDDWFRIVGGGGRWHAAPNDSRFWSSPHVRQTLSKRVAFESDWPTTVRLALALYAADMPAEFARLLERVERDPRTTLWQRAVLYHVC